MKNQKIQVNLLLVLIAALTLVGFIHQPASAEMLQVPFGDKISSVIFNYNRTTPYIATSGRIGNNGIAELKAHGFRTVLDLRTAREGTGEEQKAVQAAGLNYHNIPISGAPPTKFQVKKFAELVDNKENYPMLVHCASANRVGALWVLYKASKGMALPQALAMGRTIGMRPRREAQIRKLLAQWTK